VRAPPLAKPLVTPASEAENLAGARRLVKSSLDPGDLVPGHRVLPLRDGREAYPRMLESIRGAREHVLLETYIFADDTWGREFHRALCERAQAGVPVRVMYDAVGSSDTPREFFGDLRRAGCRVNQFNPIHGMLDPRRRRRNHRKLLVVDGRVAYAGGLNIAREYAERWRDTAVEIRGPIVAHLAYMFLTIWAKEERRHPGIPTPPIPPAEGTTATLALSSDRWKNRWRLARSYRRAIAQSTKRVWISNAYFIPSRRFLRALRLAAKRGVDVRVLVPATTDVTPVYYASRALFARLLRWGVRVFEWQGEMMHAKTAVVDGEWATVGSYNIDHLSLMHNLELSIVVVDRDFGAAMERMYEEDLRRCREVEAREWRHRPWTTKLLERFFFFFRTFL